MNMFTNEERKQLALAHRLCTFPEAAGKNMQRAFSNRQRVSRGSLEVFILEIKPISAALRRSAFSLSKADIKVANSGSYKPFRFSAKQSIIVLVFLKFCNSQHPEAVQKRIGSIAATSTFRFAHQSSASINK